MRSLLNFIIGSLRSLPLQIRYALGRFISTIIGWIPTRERTIAKLQLEKFLRPTDAALCLKGMYHALGDTLIESLSISQILDNPESIEVENTEAVESLRNDPNGKLLITAHIGNWELLAAWIVRAFKSPLTVIGRELDNQALQNELNRIREGYGVRVISKSDKSSAFTILRLLKRKQMIGALLDQDTDVESLMIPFFGVNAKTPSALITAAKKSHCSIYTTFLLRKNPGNFLLKVNKLDSQLSVSDILLEFNSQLEKIIRLYPAQWVWVHKRWRTKDNGQTLRSREYIDYLKNCSYV